MHHVVQVRSAPLQPSSLIGSHGSARTSCYELNAVLQPYLRCMEPHSSNYRNLTTTSTTGWFDTVRIRLLVYKDIGTRRSHISFVQDHTTSPTHRHIVRIQFAFPSITFCIAAASALGFLCVLAYHSTTSLLALFFFFIQVGTSISLPHTFLVSCSLDALSSRPLCVALRRIEPASFVCSRAIHLERLSSCIYTPPLFAFIPQREGEGRERARSANALAQG